MPTTFFVLVVSSDVSRTDRTGGSWSPKRRVACESKLATGFFGKRFFGCFFWESVLVLLGLRSRIFISAVFLLARRRLKISGSVDVDVGGWGGMVSFQGWA